MGQISHIYDRGWFWFQKNEQTKLLPHRNIIDIVQNKEGTSGTYGDNQ